MTASTPSAKQNRGTVELPPAEPKSPKTFDVRTIDDDATQKLGARVYRSGEQVSVEWPHGHTAADRDRAEQLLGACQHVGTALQPVRTLDETLTDRLRAAGLEYVRVSTIDGNDPLLVWSRDPSAEQRQLAAELLS